MNDNETGIVWFRNLTRGMYIAQLDDNTHTVFELLEMQPLNLNVKVHGTLKDQGSTDLLVLDTKEKISVVIQNVGCTKQHAINRANLV